MKLEGGERLVLKTLLELQGDSTDYIQDSQLANATKMVDQDVRDWLETLEGKGFVERTRLTDGFSAYVTAKGKQALRLTEPISTPKSAGDRAPVTAATPGGTGAAPPQPAATQKTAPLFGIAPSAIKGLTMNHNALAEVYVGKQDGNGEKKYDFFATGYPIAQDRVITAGHVLSGDYNFIEVRFRNSKQNAGLIPATREWLDSAKFDVAVLSCKIPKDVPGSPSLLADYDASSTKGRVLGYPRVDDTHNKPGDARKLCDSTGELGALESIASHFELQVDYDFRAQGEGWKGLSGAPVFLESRIAGIVQEYLGYATVAKFRVVAMCRLLEDPSFRAAIRWLDGPGEDVRQRTCESIERRLNRLNPDVLRDLAAELHRKGDPALQEGKDPIPIILTILLERRRFSTISRLSGIHKKLCEAGEWRAADIVAEIIEEVTPLVIDPGLAHQLCNELSVRMSAFCSVPDHHSTTIEVLMSRADGKGMKFKVPENEMAVADYEGTPLLRRDRKLPVDAPVTVESVAKSTLIDLCEGQEVRDSYEQSSTTDELVQRLAGVLIVNSIGLNEDRTLYCLHKLPKNQREHSVHIEALTLIRDKLDTLKRAKPDQLGDLPGFVFLLLAETSELEDLRSIVVSWLKTRFNLKRK